MGLEEMEESSITEGGVKILKERMLKAGKVLLRTLCRQQRGQKSQNNAMLCLAKARPRGGGGSSERRLITNTRPMHLERNTAVGTPTRGGMAWAAQHLGLLFTARGGFGRLGGSAAGRSAGITACSMYSAKELSILGRRCLALEVPRLLEKPPLQMELDSNNFIIAAARSSLYLGYFAKSMNWTG